MRWQRPTSGLAVIGCLLLLAACSSGSQLSAAPGDLMVSAPHSGDASPSDAAGSASESTSESAPASSSAQGPTTSAQTSAPARQIGTTATGSRRSTTTPGGSTKRAATMSAGTATGTGRGSAGSKVTASTPATPAAKAAKAVGVAAPRAANPLVLGPGTESVQEAEVVRLVNQQRIAAGCSALTVSPILVTVARAHSQEMSGSTDGIKHNSNDGRTPFQRMTAAGYPYSMAAENIAAGQSTAVAVMTAWLGSHLHRQNIVNCGLSQIGVGMIYKPGSQYGTYWTQDFGTSM
jgi:uncharacterized protein YkwD